MASIVQILTHKLYFYVQLNCHVSLRDRMHFAVRIKRKWYLKISGLTFTAAFKCRLEIPNSKLPPNLWSKETKSVLLNKLYNLLFTNLRNQFHF